jgi:hypothetical protein
LRDDGVDIDFPCRDEIQGAPKYQKKHNAAGADSIVAELLKNGGPNLVDANAAVQHYQAGFQSGKSTTDQLFALRQILEKCNEFNITTHHLFKDFN